jgi:hypothetical protein
MNKIKIYSLLVLISLFCYGAILAQVNIKVGYTGGFMKAPVLNKVVDDFNTKYNKFEDKLDPFKSIHGIEIGVRYRMNKVGFELSWNSLSDKSDVIGQLPAGESFKDKWFFSMTEYSAGIENYFGNFGYGASLGLRTAKMKTDITGSRKKRLVSEETGLSSKFYLIFQYPGQKVGIAFKPYVQYPLKNMDVSAFDHDLNVQLDNSYIAVKPQEEKFFIYGISILLYNGKQ